MGKKSGPPKPPDPYATAQAQTKSNLDTARKETELNRYNVNSPFGGVQWTNNGDRWTQNVIETPEQARLRQQEEQLGYTTGQLAQGQVDRLGGVLDTPYQSDRLDIAGALGNYGEDVTNRTRDVLNRGVGEWARRGQESLDSRLASQGINLGSDAFTRAQQDWGGTVANAYADNEIAARGEGRTDRATALGELLGQYSADTSADVADRSTPIQEIGYLAGLGQYTPINPGQGAMANLQPTDYAGIMQQGYANNLARYNTQMQQRGGLLGSLAGLGSAAITGGFFPNPWKGG